MHTEILTDPRRAWARRGRVRCRGYAFRADGVALGAADLADSLADIHDPEACVLRVAGLNGFFSLICELESGVLLAVDRLRSHPLFYAFAGDAAYISDDPHWIKERLCLPEDDGVSLTELALAGFVSGPHTLCRSIKQVVAGEAVFIPHAGGEAGVSHHRYYRFAHRDYREPDPAALSAQLDRVLVAAFERLVKYADGRTIVVPLSGGLDSRLVVLMLRRMGYGDVVTYSYGRPGNRESEVSRTVAHSLGCRWEFIPYSRRQWRKWFTSQERLDYYRFADGLSAVPHIQDWPAVWELRRRGLVPPDSVFVPGHSADLPAGSRSIRYPELYTGQQLPPHLVVERLLGAHYRLHDDTAATRATRAALSERVLSSLGDIASLAGSDPATVFESYDVHERQAKFIVNSVRVYEFWGYDWWLPYWDNEFVDFWMHVPVALRRAKRLYSLYVDDLYARVTGSPAPGTGQQPGSDHRSAADHSRRYVRWIRRALRPLDFYRHPLALYGVTGRQAPLPWRDFSDGVNRLLARHRIGLIRF